MLKRGHFILILDFSFFYLDLNSISFRCVCILFLHCWLFVVKWFHVKTWFQSQVDWMNIFFEIDLHILYSSTFFSSYIQSLYRSFFFISNSRSPFFLLHHNGWQLISFTSQFICIAIHVFEAKSFCIIKLDFYLECNSEIIDSTILKIRLSLSKFFR